MTHKATTEGKVLLAILILAMVIIRPTEIIITAGTRGENLAGCTVTYPFAGIYVENPFAWCPTPHLLVLLK